MIGVFLCESLQDWYIWCILEEKKKYMIAGNELRTGNIVSIPMCGINAIVEIIGQNHFCVDATNLDLSYENSDFNLEDADAIDLTGDMLLELGFDTDTYYNYFKKISEYASLVISMKDGCRGGIWESVSVADHDLDINVRYVHQLQNLYFALTGEELSIANLTALY